LFNVRFNTPIAASLTQRRLEIEKWLERRARGGDPKGDSKRIQARSKGE